ncbi:MAG: hypothetical protein ACOCNL_14555 [Acetivibrio ethanolgignens]
MNELKDFLKTKLNAADYLEAEKLLDVLVKVTETEAFEDGSRYVSELWKELNGD